MTAKARPEALFLVDRQGRDRFFMEGTQSCPLAAPLLERHAEGLNGVDNIGLAHRIEPSAVIVSRVGTGALAEPAGANAALYLLRNLRELIFAVRDPIAERLLVEAREVARGEIA